MHANVSFLIKRPQQPIFRFPPKKKADATLCQIHQDRRCFRPFPGGGAEPRFSLLPLQIRCQHGARVDQSVEIGFADGVQGQGSLFQRAIMVHGVMRDL